MRLPAIDSWGAVPKQLVCAEPLRMAVHDLRKSLLHETAGVRQLLIRDPVIDARTVSPRCKDTTHAHHLEMLRGIRLRCFQRFRKITDGHLARFQQVKDLKAFCT